MFLFYLLKEHIKYIILQIKGATAVEYALIVSLVGIAAATGIQIFGIELDQFFGEKSTILFLITEIMKSNSP